MNEELSGSKRREIIENLSASTSELTAVQTQLAALRAHEQRLESEIFSLRSSIAPIKQLHRDILAEIFIQCRPTPSTIGRYPSMIFTEAPLLFQHVCRTWREIANSTPALWDAINIVVPLDAEDAERLMDKHEMMAREWLQRAGARGISISFARGTGRLPCSTALDQGGLAMNLETAQFIERMLGVVKEFTTSWKTFSSGIDWSDVARALADVSLTEQPSESDSTPSQSIHALASQVEMPLLEELEIYLAYHNRRNHGEFDIHAYTFPPSLRRFIFRGPVARAWTLQLPWERLTHLKLVTQTHTGMPQAYALQMLRRCPNLEDCAISVSEPSVHSPGAWTPPPPFAHSDTPLEPAEPMTPLILPHLKALAVVTISSDHADQFFANLSTPALRKLSYTSLPLHYPPWPPGHANHQQEEQRAELPFFPHIAPLDSLVLRVPFEPGWYDMLPNVLDYLRSGIQVRKLRMGALTSDLLIQLVEPCRQAGIERLDLDVLPPPPPTPPPPPPNATMWIHTRPGRSSISVPEITTFVDALAQPREGRSGGSGDEESAVLPPKLKEITLTVSSIVLVKQEAEFDAYAEKLKADCGIVCNFKYPYKRSRRSRPVMLADPFGHDLIDII
jgi:hypothetical protein